MLQKPTPSDSGRSTPNFTENSMNKLASFAFTIPLLAAITSSAEAAEPQPASDLPTPRETAEQSGPTAPKQEQLGKRGQVMISSSAQVDMRTSLALAGMATPRSGSLHRSTTSFLITSR
jgi:hypothetical protein